MFSIIRITILSLLSSGLCQPVLASNNRNNSVEVEKEDKGIRRPSLSLDSSNVYGSVPTGSIISFAGDKALDGWLLCDGQQCSSQKYPELYSVIGMKYVLQDSWIHQANKHAQSEQFFCVPDLRGRTAIGVDSNANRVTANNILGASSGEEKHQLTVDELANHTHNVQFMKPGGSFNVHTDGAKLVTMPKTENDQGVEKTSLNSTGQNKPHNNMQPYLVLNYIIKTGQEKTNNQQNKIAQRDVELDSQHNEIAQLKQKLNNLEIGSAKAWVVFNGTNATISDSYGVSSIIKNSTGVYTINFSKPFNSTNYCSVLQSGTGTNQASHTMAPRNGLSTKTSFTLMTANWNGTYADLPYISACFYGRQ